MTKNGDGVEASVILGSTVEKKKSMELAKKAYQTFSALYMPNCNNAKVLQISEFVVSILLFNK
jgi:hypothetical protein